MSQRRDGTEEDGTKNHRAKDDKARLEDLGARIKAAQNEETEKQEAGRQRQESSQGVGIGMRIGIELLVAVLVGGGIGLFIDTKLGTKPIFMLAFLVLGFTAGVMDVLRVIKGLDTAVGLGRAVREKEVREKAGQEKAAKGAQAPPNAEDDDD